MFYNSVMKVTIFLLLNKFHNVLLSSSSLSGRLLSSSNSFTWAKLFCEVFKSNVHIREQLDEHLNVDKLIEMFFSFLIDVLPGWRDSKQLPVVKVSTWSLSVIQPKAKPVKYQSSFTPETLCRPVQLLVWKQLVVMFSRTRLHADFTLLLQMTFFSFTHS